MARRVTVDVLVHDSFNVLAADGITKVTGLVQATDFAITVFRDGAVVTPFTVTVTEIGTTGEYDVQFTPDQIGYWEVHIESTTQTPNRRFEGEYQVESVQDGALPGQVFHDRVTDDRGNGLPYVTVEVFEADTANLLATTTTAYDGSFQIALTGTLALATLVDVRFSGGGIQTFIKEDVRLS